MEIGVVRKLRLTLAMIAFSHSIFALPFAGASFILAHYFNNLEYKYLEILYILSAMIAARNSAMAFNRWVDCAIDARNPRTLARHLPSKLISNQYVILFILSNSLLFIIICYFINKLAFILSPLTLIFICFYSFTKRFTSYSHFVLGLALAIAPVGAWIAVTGELYLLPLLMGSGVLFWVAGFDILYSLQDEHFDQSNGLFSIPARWGTRPALWIARLCHGLAALSWVTLGLSYALGSGYFIALGVIALVLVWEHCLLSPGDLSRLNRAFFTANGAIGLIYFIGVMTHCF